MKCKEDSFLNKWFRVESLKTKAKVAILSNHNRSKEDNDAITLNPRQGRETRPVRTSHDRFWFYM